MLKEPASFAIIFNHKYNSEISRDAIIKQLAELVMLKNGGNKVNLKTPEKTIIVEVVKGLCMLSVVPDYYKLKKFNLHALSKTDEEETGEKLEAPEKDNEEVEEKPEAPESTDP